MKHPDQCPIIFGEVLFDCFDDGSCVLGGAPFNVAWHLQAFGLGPLLVSRVGSDALGDEIADTMRGWGMRATGLQRDPEHATGEVSIHLKQGQPSFEIPDQRAYDFIEDVPLEDVNPALIYHGSLALRNAPSQDALTSLIARQPAPIFMDVNLRRPWWNADVVRTLIGRSHWVKINEEELGLLSDEAASIADMAARMVDRYDLECLIVTLGERGAFALQRDGVKVDVEPAGRAEVVDAVGAGDAFASVCILGISRKWPWKMTMQRAQQFAARLVTQRGAIVKDPDTYRSLLSQWQSAGESADG